MLHSLVIIIALSAATELAPDGTGGEAKATKDSSVAAATNDSEIYWWRDLIFLCVPAAFGGVLAVLRYLEIPRLLLTGDQLFASKLRLTCSIIVGALGGIGAAIAVVSVFALDGRLAKPPTESDKLLLISIGIIAGFLGFRLLGKIADDVADKFKIADLERKTNTVAEDTKRIEAEMSQKEIETAIAIGCMAANLAADGKPDRQMTTTSKKQIADILKLHPGHRGAAIVLGRLYRHAGDIDTAIRILSDAIDVRRKTAIEREPDAADLYYNRACYYFKEKGDVRNALDDLKVAVEIDPANGPYAREDKDFRGLEGNAEFTRIVDGCQNANKEAGPPNGPAS